MASKSKSSGTRVCGKKVQVVYAFRDEQLVYSHICREHKEFLLGFPIHAHFAVKVTKALVRTTNPVDVYRWPDQCTLAFARQTAAPMPTDMDIRFINENCEAPRKEKRKQLASGKTRPVVIEKIKTDDVFAKPYHPEGLIEYSYKRHSPRLLKTDIVGRMREHEELCRTANAIDISPPLMLFYGNGYHYNIIFKTWCRERLQDNPHKTIIFYGHLCETLNHNITGDEEIFFSDMIPRIYAGERAELDPEDGCTPYESGIDDYDDTSDDEWEDEVFEKEATENESD